MKRHNFGALCGKNVFLMCPTTILSTLVETNHDKRQWIKFLSHSKEWTWREPGQKKLVKSSYEWL